MDEQPALPELLPGLLEAVTAVAKLEAPDASDVYYYRNMPDYKELSSACSSQIQQLLRTARTNLTRQPSAAATAGTAVDADEVEEALYEDLEATLDDMFERLDTALDAAKQETEQFKLGGWAATAGSRQALRATAKGLNFQTATAGFSRGKILRHVANLPRPQDSFPDPVDNSNTPWSPSRFNHLAARLTAAADSTSATDRLQAHAKQLAAAAGVGSSARSEGSSAVHPYAAELSSLQYPFWQCEAPPQSDITDLADTPFQFVDTADQLTAMVEELTGERQIAIDLEHHSYRSFQGFTCLMQVSTRTHDFVVDCLSLRAELGPALCDIMADATVEKVLHGADSDVMWLQRDFGLYLVNMFDTGQAARVLNYPSASLAYLLERHTGFKADKRYQLADWRVRPLSEDMLHYARCDTHFLLHVADAVKRELIAAGDMVPEGWRVDVPQQAGTDQTALGVVLERSRQLCLSMYEKPLFSEHSYIEQAARWQLQLPPRNMAVFAALFAWRDRTARGLDESVSYVIPKAALIELSRAAPQTAAELRKLLGSGSGLAGGSGFLLTRAEEVVQVILSGQQQAAVTASVAAAPARGEESPAPASGVEVKPRQLPALRPKALPALSGKKSGGITGATAGGVKQPAGVVVAAEHKAPPTAEVVNDTASKADKNAIAAEQHIGKPSGNEQQQEAMQEQQEAEQQHQQQSQVSEADTAPRQVKSIIPRKRAGSSLAGLLSSKPKLQNGASQQQQLPTAKADSIKSEAFKLAFMKPAKCDTAAAGDTHTTATAAAGKQTEDTEQQQQQQQQQFSTAVTGAEVRTLVDQLLAQNEQQQEDGGEQDADEVTTAAAAAAAASNGVHVAGGSSGVDLADLEYVPLSAQIDNKKKGNKQAHRKPRQNVEAAYAADQPGSHPTDPLQQRQQSSAPPPAAAASDVAQHPPRKRKRGGIFAAAVMSDSDGSSSSSDDSDDDGLLPAYDPNSVKSAAAAAAAKDDHQHHKSTDDAAAADTRSDRRPRGRGGRSDRGGGRGRSSSKRSGFMAAATASLAAVRARQGGGGVGANPFAIPDTNMIRGGKRTAVAPRGGNRSASFK